MLRSALFGKVPAVPSPDFTDYYFYIALWRHSDRNNEAITRGFISLINDNHVDNNLRKCPCLYALDWL